MGIESIINVDMQSGDNEPRYITRLMKMECSMGTVKNYINVGTDHGVLAGGNCDAQPVMNANDHTSKNVIHFGNCNSEKNPERSFRKGLVALLTGAGGYILMKQLEKMGVITYKCKPNTPRPWINANEDCIIEGAPALTMQSQLACRYGGEIKFVLEDPTDSGEQETNNENEEEVQVPEDIVNDAFNEAVEAAMKEISDVGEVGEKAVEKVQLTLALAAAMPAQQSGKAASTVGTAVGTSAAAIYVTVRSIDPDVAMTYDQAVQQMGEYGVIEHPQIGTMSLGVANALNEMGYETQYCFEKDIETISNKAADAGAGVMMYTTTEGCGCVAFQANPIEADTDEQYFTFYSGVGDEGISMTWKEFDSMLSAEGSVKLGSVTILVDKPDSREGICECDSCMGGE